MDGIYGWFMLIGGVLLLVIEALVPGFFIAVPGTILVVMGILVILAPGLLTFPWGLIIFAVVAVAVSAATLVFYRKLAPGQKPSLTSMESLAGSKGYVIKEVVPGTIDGKVKIDEQIWSATSNEKIGEGEKVIVTRAEGVHVIVCKDTEKESLECKQ